MSSTLYECPSCGCLVAVRRRAGGDLLTLECVSCTAVMHRYD